MAQSPTAKKATDTDTQLVTNEQPSPTFGIIAALTKEYTAVKVLLENRRIHPVPGRGAGRQYLLGRVPSASGGSHSVVLALADKGNNMAAARATLLLEHFPNVKSIIMVGIAGGVPNPKKPDEHVRLGDIVVSNQKGVVQYDFGKETIAKIVPDPPPRPPSASLLEAVRLLEAAEIEGNRPWLKYIDQARHLLKITRPKKKTDVLVCSTNLGRTIPHPKDPNRVLGESKVFIGPVAAANRVLKNPIKRDQLRDRFGVKAVEMEGSGIADATWYHEVGYLVVRGICDYCDSNKGNDWQKYAAVVASAYTRALLESIPCHIPEKAASNTTVERVLLKKEKQFELQQVWSTFKQNDIPQKCLRKLISLQYPWGEFSDQRTPRELQAAERSGSYIVPKPNLARTLFTVEALRQLDKELFKPYIEFALKWVSQCIVDGWFKEWLPDRVLDSEGTKPVLKKHPSVRHTAQAGTIHVQFRKESAPIKKILENILKSQLRSDDKDISGAWSENPNDTKPTPAFLSTFYALEFLLRLVEGQFRLDVDDLICDGKTRVWNALDFGFGWLSGNIMKGDGLGGTAVGGASSYWTAMMLYRLGKFLKERRGFPSRKIVEALKTSRHPQGWRHEPEGPPKCKRDRLRYNIRVLAGLCTIGEEGLGYEYQLIRKAAKIIASFFDLRVLDTPDCAIIVQIAIWLGKDNAKRTLVDSYKPYPVRLRQNRLERWCRRFRLVRQSLQESRNQGIPDYSGAYEEVDNKVQMLEEEIYALKKKKRGVKFCP